MKITKIKTKMGEPRFPVSTELDAVVERMRSEENKEAARCIAAITLKSRLMIDKGLPRFFLEDTDRLPYLVFSATFGKGGVEKPISFTQLLLLNIPCPEGHRQVEEIKKRVEQLPYTLLAFAGVSGVTLKVVVRCEYSGDARPWESVKGRKRELDADTYLIFLKEAHACAARLYTTLVRCDLLVGEQTITRGCRMSYDPKLYYNPKALPLPVVREEGDVLKPYEGTKTDDDGTVPPSEGGDDPDQPTVDWDATSSANLWNAVENGSAFISVTPWFANDGWSQIGDPEWKHANGEWTLTIPEGMGGSQWQGQFPINTSLTASKNKKYNVYLVLEADQDCNGVTIKLTETDEADGTKHDDNFFFADRHDVKADVPFVFKAKAVTLPKNDAHALSLFFDFGGSPIGTNIKISKIYFEESVELSYDDANNLWKGVDEGQDFVSVTPWFANDGWSQIGDPVWEHKGNKWSLTIPEGMGGSQWQGQFPINTKLATAQNDAYNFQCTILADEDCNGITIKLTQTDEASGTKHDDNFYFADRHDVKADEPFVYTMKGVTLPKNDAHALSLFFDFGGSPIGTNIVISDIIFEKAE